MVVCLQAANTSRRSVARGESVEVFSLGRNSMFSRLSSCSLLRMLLRWFGESFATRRRQSETRTCSHAHMTRRHQR
jgi:hypothetical protein